MRGRFVIGLLGLGAMTEFACRSGGGGQTGPQTALADLIADGGPMSGIGIADAGRSLFANPDAGKSLFTNPDAGTMSSPFAPLGDGGGVQ